ncbi:MAG: hypothetical protein A2252_12355 [Elusimicrobia bacterium RIFOXYA2_FULL_39_19]|nr:MAG: hypothetical protein A2252_12355 [Elusimicrobia bacterium RIFOXYA2_FULL_39_19]
MKLRTQFSILVSILILVIMLVLGTVLFVYEKQQILTENRNNQVVLLKNYITVCEESLPMDDDLMIINYSDMLVKTDPVVVYASFIGGDGKILHSRKNSIISFLVGNTDIKQQRTNDIKTQEFVLPAGEKILDIYFPVFKENNVAGFAHIGLNQKEIDKRIADALSRMKNRIFAVTFFAVLTGITGSFLLAFKLTQPINKLVDGARKLGEGKLDTKIKVNTKDEIGLLSKEFNIMAEKLQELDELKNSFVSSVSHELRSPLSYIKGYIELFLEDSEEKLDKKQIEYFGIIRKNITRLTMFVNDVLDVAKIEAKQLIAKTGKQDIAFVIDEITDFAQPGLEEKKINLRKAIAPGLPQVLIDEDKTRHIISNLLNNAIKFCPENGTITIGALVEGSYVKVFVKDTGIGIPKEALNTIFEKFRQAKAEHEKVGKVKGSGLGLTIAKGFVELQGGKIWVESELDKGSTFFFTVLIAK